MQAVYFIAMSARKNIMILKNFINGQYLDNSSGHTFDVINPATGLVAYKVEVADEKIRNAAIESSQQGFETWSAMTGFERNRILLKAVSLLRERNEIAHPK